MGWIKRNYGLVISGVVALALLGLAVFYLLQKKDAAAQATARLDEDMAKLDRLTKRNPAPNPENIKSAKDDHKMIEAFVGVEKRFFHAPPHPAKINNREFGNLLTTKIFDWERMAKAFGVGLPQNYKFSFASQANQVNIAAEALEPLTLQIAEVDTICQILFYAKINSLESVKRASVTSDEIAGSTDFVSTKPVTNEWTIANPYQVTFFGFTPELGAVLEGFAKASNCITVKDIVVERASSATTAGLTTDGTGASASLTGPSYMPAADSPRFLRPPPDRSFSGGGLSAQSYRMRAPMPPPVVPPPAAARPASGVVVEEHLLRITISLETVRLRPAGSKAASAPRPAAPPQPVAESTATPEGRVIQ